MEGTEQNDLKALSGHIRQLSDELTTEREARAKEAKEGISILRLHVPLAVLLMIVGVLVSAGVAGGMFVRITQSHLDNRLIHADETEAATKGGIAYVKDVKTGLADAVSDLQAANRRIGRAVRTTTCTTDRHGVTKCSFPDPEALPLRP